MFFDIYKLNSDYFYLFIIIVMKKVLFVSILLWCSFLIAGCGKQNDKNVDTQLRASDTEAVVNNGASLWTCEGNWWVLTNRVDWWNITVCLFDDNSFCFLEDLENWMCEKGFLPFEDGELAQEEVESEFNSCDQMDEEIVCGKDGWTYSNRCYLEASWVEEETAAEVVDGRCIFA